jgi:hypothetical protein
MESSAWPGITHTGARTARPAQRSSTTSWLARPPARCCRADHRHVVPAELAQRTRYLEQPPVVGETTVIHRRVRSEDELEVAIGRRLPDRQATRPRRARRHAHWLRRGSADRTIVQARSPETLKIATAGHGSPEALDDFVAGDVRLIRELRQQLVYGMPVVQRCEYGLEDGGCAIECSGVAPRLERMELGDVPVAPRGGLIGEEPDMDSHADVLECSGKVDIRGRGVHRIAAQAEQE